ncbi:methyltransferase domain-containing protein [Streptomyces sp. NPDC005962]|uniref:SAM-dependent methyltransferase n=1 Tax=Streptomyces sp. NPDC005962 TaxID=3154466 RepID=UPI0033F629BA
MTSPSPAPPGGQVSDYYSSLGPLLQMAWDDNFHFGYWDGPSDTSSVQEATDRFTDLLIERLRVGPGDRVLDVGCGIGKPALRVASTTGAGVLGITISELQVGQATEAARAEHMSDRVSFQYADGMAMPFGDASFDAVLAFESINHMHRPTALREMARVLAPGGRLVLTDVTPPADGSYQPENDPDAVTSLTGMRDWPGLITDAGLRLDELRDVTEHTKDTANRMIDGILKCRREFEERHGVSVQEVLDAAKSALPTVGSAGCAIVVAHKL